jgi:hypothetical protein
MLTSLGAALGETFKNVHALIDYLLAKKSYSPTHETAAVALMVNPACRYRTAQMLRGLCDALRSPAGADTPLFVRIAADSTDTMHVFRFAPQ